jgi:hypothetical protein
MIIEKCIICCKDTPQTDKIRKARSSAEVTRYFRQSKAITCSHKCSEIYKRIYHRIKGKIRNDKIKKEKLALKQSTKQEKKKCIQ